MTTASEQLNRLECLFDLYAHAGQVETSYDCLRNGVALTFKGSSAADAIALASMFGIAMKCRSKREAVQKVTERIIGRLESLKRIQF